MPTVGRINEPAAVRQLVVDDVTLSYLVDGSMALNPGVFFPAIPQLYWQQHPDLLDAHGRVAMSAGGLLVDRGEHKLLIAAAYEAVDAETPLGRIQCGAFLTSLASLEVSSEEIPVFALTHIHVDHIGWAFGGSRDGPRHPTLPNARYVPSGAEWEPHGRGQHSRGTPDVPTVVEPLGEISHRFVDGASIAPNVTAVVTSGHSAGHASYAITTSRGARIVAFWRRVSPSGATVATSVGFRARR